MQKKHKIIIFLLVIGFFSTTSFALAAKKSKWQALLEKNGIPQEYWQPYLPKINRQEYRSAITSFISQQAPVAPAVPTTPAAPETTAIKTVEGKYPLPATTGKIAREQHLWLKSSQSASSHYEMTNTPASCRNGMAGGFGAFGSLSKSDKEEEKYYVTMRWGYANWVEPASQLENEVSKSSKSLSLKTTAEFARSGYVKIGSEYVHYSSKSGGKLKGLKRGYKSSAASHDQSDGVKQVYRYKGGQWERVTRALDSDTKKRGWFKKRKVLVTNTRNGKKVVASILESGPAIWTGRVGGLSPEAFDAIGANSNEVCSFQYADEDAKLGKVN